VEEVDKKRNGFLEGRTRTNYIVHFPGDPELIGKTVRIKVLNSRAVHLMGEMVN
jgi:tRNA-2-methylthio-N6-dimethylallyladenosine synthase